MIKQTPVTMAMERFVEIRAQALEIFAERYITPLMDIGSPEQILGKPYLQMTEPDFQLAAQIYGQQLDRWMVKRELQLATQKGAFNG